MSTPGQAVSRTPPDRRLRLRLSGRRRWRVIQIVGLLGLLVVVSLIVLAVVTVGYTRPPRWVVDVREYRVTGRLSLILTVLLLVNIALTWLLGVASAVAGARVLGGGSGTLRYRLHIVHRRFTLAILTAVLFRLGVLITLLVSALYAYTRYLGPRLASGPPSLIEQAVGRNPVAAALLVPIVLVGIIGPVLRVRFNAALGALAATHTRGQPERVALGLAARFGVGLVSVLLAVWVWSGLLLVLITIADPVSYQSSMPFPSKLGPAGTPLVLILASVGAVLYAAGQTLLSLIFVRVAALRMRDKQKAAPSQRSSGL